MSVQDQSTNRPEVSVSSAPTEWTPPTGEAAQEQVVGKHRAKLAVAGALVAAVAATAGITAAVVGAGNDNTASSTTGGPGGTAQGFPGAGGQPMGADGTAGGRGAATASLHGTSVVSDGNGGYVTQETQTGTVSALSTNSITVKSADGYTKTYIIASATAVDNGADTIADVAAGHTVRVVATTSGGTATATTLTDTNLATTTDQQGGSGAGAAAPQQPA